MDTSSYHALRLYPRCVRPLADSDGTRELSPLEHYIRVSARLPRFIRAGGSVHIGIWNSSRGWGEPRPWTLVRLGGFSTGVGTGRHGEVKHPPEGVSTRVGSPCLRRLYLAHGARGHSGQHCRFRAFITQRRGGGRCNFLHRRPSTMRAQAAEVVQWWRGSE